MSKLAAKSAAKSTRKSVSEAALKPRFSVASLLRRKISGVVLLIADRDRSHRIDRWFATRLLSRETANPLLVRWLATRAEGMGNRFWSMPC